MSAGKMWKVTLPVCLVVMAEDAQEARELAVDLVENAGGDPDGDGAAVAEITCADEVPANWRNSIPFCGSESDERRCLDRVPKKPAKRPVEVRKDLPEEITLKVAWDSGKYCCGMDKGHGRVWGKSLHSAVKAARECAMQFYEVNEDDIGLRRLVSGDMSFGRPWVISTGVAS